MAKRYALVPESWLQSVSSNSTTSKENVILDSVTKEEKELPKLVDLLPKNLRGKAKILLHYIDGKVKVNEYERIVYDDGNVGSYLLDMVRYYVSPLVKTRPLDAPRFEALLNKIGVPSSALARPRFASSSIDPLANWKRI